MANPKYIDKHQSWIRNFWEHLKLRHSQGSLYKSVLSLLPLLLGLVITRWAVKWTKKYSSQEDYGMAISYSLRKSELGLLLGYCLKVQRPDVMTFGSRLQRKKYTLEYGPEEYGFLGKKLNIKEIKMVVEK